MKIKLLLSFLLIPVCLLANVVLPPSATISYSSPVVCTGSGLQVVTLIGTTGGTFSATGVGLSIDPATGTINPTTSLPGTYVIFYDIPASPPDPAFSCTTQFTIVAEPNPGIDGSTTICDSQTAVINLYGLISGEDTGGTWTRTAGTGGIFNAAAGTFTPGFGATTSIFSYAVATVGDCAAMPSMAIVTVNPAPYAGANGSVSVCNDNLGVINLYDIIVGEQSGGVWTRISGTGGSLNAATGVYTPDLNSTNSQFMYTIPGTVPCANANSLAVVNFGSAIVPTFSFPTTYCLNSFIPGFPTTSNNGITGTWSPAVVSNQISATYTFTPNPGQCADVATVSITIGDVQPVFSFGSSTVCAGNAPVLETTSANGVTGTWNPATITASGVYTFTPNAGQCATSITETFTVNPLPMVVISGTSPVCEGTVGVVSFVGTPNATVTYTYNNFIYQTIVLDATGSAIISMPPSVVGTYAVCLVSVSSNGAVNCTNNVSGCATIVVTPAAYVSPMPDVTVCGGYTLPALQLGNYFTQPGGAGTMLNAGDVITETMTVYVYASNDCGTDEESFVITVIPVVNPTIATAGDIHYIIVEDNQIVQTLQLNTEVQTGNYTYQWMESQQDIIGANSASYTVNNLVSGGWHYYSVRITNNDSNCVSVSPIFQVFETQVPAPVGDPNQTFTPGQTLADVIISGQNIQWYDAFNRGVNPTPLPLSTVLMAGVTYYATQTIGGYESASAFEITIQFLANEAFAFEDLKFSPNPVRDVLHIASKDMIQQVSVYNMVGQKIMQQNGNSLDLRLPLQQLTSGNYFIKLESDNKSQVIKVIKQ